MCVCACKYILSLDRKSRRRIRVDVARDLRRANEQTNERYVRTNSSSERRILMRVRRREDSVPDRPTATIDATTNTRPESARIVVRANRSRRRDGRAGYTLMSVSRPLLVTPPDSLPPFSRYLEGRSAKTGIRRDDPPTRQQTHTHSHILPLRTSPRGTFVRDLTMRMANAVPSLEGRGRRAHTLARSASSLELNCCKGRSSSDCCAPPRRKRTRNRSRREKPALR